MARKRYKTTVVRTLRQLGACEAGLQYVAGKTFDQAWEHCTSASFYIWWIRQVWVRYPDLRQRYFEDGHHNHVQIVTDALDTERTRSAELKVIHALAYEAPDFLRRMFRLTAKRWAQDQGLRVTRKSWK